MKILKEEIHVVLDKPSLTALMRRKLSERLSNANEAIEYEITEIKAISINGATFRSIDSIEVILEKGEQDA